jgi:carbonic anhydrase
MESPYQAERTWSSARPHTLVVCCSDGRWHAQNSEFVAQEVDKRADLFAVPGGAAVVDPWSSSFDEARVFDNSMRLLVQYHELRTVWLISHHDCAYYKVRHPELDEQARLVRQRADLLRAARLIKEGYPQLMLRCVHANLVGDKVVYEPVG